MKKFLKIKKSRKGFFNIISEYFRYKEGKKVEEKTKDYGSLGKNIIAKRIIKAVEETAKKFPKAKSPIRDSDTMGKCICFNDSNGNRCILSASDDAGKNLIQYVADSLIISATE